MYRILVGIKFGGLAQNRYCKNIGGFKFGSSVRDHHTYTSMRLGNFGGFQFGGWNIDRQTAKFNSPQNFQAIRYTRFSCQVTGVIIIIINYYNLIIAYQ